MTNVVRFPSVQVLSEPFVTRKAFAGLLGVSVRTVDYWLADGLPHERWGRRMVRIQPRVAVAWIKAREEAA